PEDWRTGIAKGAFAGPLPTVPGNVTLVSGLFSDTLPQFSQQHLGPIAFLHVDCDLYSSTATIFDCLGDRLRPGSVILFDEYFNYPGWRQHEFKAFQEFVARGEVAYRYEGFVPRDQQVCVVLE
ncbi:class I SAM-dependent methyltransferase, partial [Microbacteriaceae bacterium K1510]|nr:class I SAM-dependent methyltransferase [Microbacteriaceae bacterium K1510]